MSDPIVVAWIGFGSAALVAALNLMAQVIINRKNREKRVAEDAEKEQKRAIEEALKEERLAARLNSIVTNLEENNRQLKIHNGYADKIGSIQTDIAFIKGKLEGD